MSSRFFKSAIFMLVATLFVVSQLYAQGSVFTMTNSPSGNEVLVFNRTANGSLVLAGTFPTGGFGTGGSLGNQGAIRISPSGRRLLVANSGSDNITIFRITDQGLLFDQRVASGGERPISLLMRGNRVFVLNAGGSVRTADSVVGFSFNENGTLTRIPGATQRLSAASTNPTQISITPDGAILIVTEQATNRISTFSVNFDGTMNAINSQLFNGITPSGFAVGTGGRVFVSEAGANGAVNASTISSFAFNSAGTLQQITTSMPTAQTSGASMAFNNDNSIGFVGNSGSGTITGFRVSNDGSIVLLNPNGISANVGPGTTPAELALSNNSRFLFSLNPGTNTISTFQVAPNGTLSPLGQTPTALPAGSFNGLAAQ